MPTTRSQTRKSETPSKAPKPEAFEYEFGGPIGALGVMLGLPTVIYALYFTCGEHACLAHPLVGSAAARDVVAKHTPAGGPSALFDTTATLVLVAWIGFQVALERMLPGEDALGVPLKGAGKGARLVYRLNGHLAFWVSMLAVVPLKPTLEHRADGGLWLLDWAQLPLAYLYDAYLPLISAAVAFSFALSFALYAASLRRGALLAEGGESGSIVYDLFIGRELNPRVGTFDLKYFCELRPGLIGWALLNAGMAAKQAAKHGAVSSSMALLVLFQVRRRRAARARVRARVRATARARARFSLTTVAPRSLARRACTCGTRSTTSAPSSRRWTSRPTASASCSRSETSRGSPSRTRCRCARARAERRFGRALIASAHRTRARALSQARYLVDHDPALSTPAIIAICALKAVGYSIFRGANSEKDAFRRDPDAAAVQHLRWMPTKRGTRLLISGYWGLARKINYTGDWLMGLAWCLLCGGGSIIPCVRRESERPCDACASLPHHLAGTPRRRYFYAIYFAVLLIHRAYRDDHFCAQKYGGDWAAYKKEVPYMFIPYVL